MTAEDRACAVQLLRSAAADHLTHLDPAERDELVERISAAIDRCGRRRAAAVLRAAAQEQRNEADNVPDTDEGTHADGHRCAAEFIDRRAERLAHHEEAL